jgi:uncharacterized membrane protein YraQ (UPF0718 family)
MAGLVTGSLISVFCKEHISKAIEKLNHKKWGMFGIIPAVFLGILSTLCMYGKSPLWWKVQEDWITAFLVCSILLNTQLLSYTIALGVLIMIMYFIVCFFAGIAAGLLIRFFFHNIIFYKFTDEANTV